MLYMGTKVIQMRGFLGFRGAGGGSEAASKGGGDLTAKPYNLPRNFL